MSLHAVCSIEAGTSTEWQAALLAYSWGRAGIQAPLTVLSAGGMPREPIAATIVVTGNARHVDGGNYAPWNKPYSLLEWLSGPQAPLEDTILLLDPDMTVFGPVDGPSAVPSSYPVGELYTSMPASLREPIVRAMTPNPQLLQPVGVPLWINRDALATITPRWIEHIGQLRRAQLPDDRWISEMVGYALACADFGLWHTEVMVSCGPTLFHYFFGHCGLLWNKADYHPWDAPATASSNAPSVVQAFAGLLAEYAALRRGAAEQLSA